MTSFLKVFGILDICAASIMVLMHYSIGTWRLTLLFAMYLLFKAFAFSGDFQSIVDGIIGVYLILLIFGIHSIVTFIAAIYLLQKGIVSVLS